MSDPQQTIDKMSTKDQGLMDVGVHCASCGRLDFLPFKCFGCSQSFCGEHRKDHPCVDSAELIKETGRSKSDSTSKSSSRMTSPTRCPRAEVTRKCLAKSNLAKPTRPTGSAAALAKLKELFPSAGKTRKPVVTPMLELKKNAKGDSSVAPQDRLYFYLQRPSTSTREGVKLPVFYSKKMIAGKLLDVACNKLDLSTKQKFDTGRPRLFINNETIKMSLKLGDIPQLNGETPAVISIK